MEGVIRAYNFKNFSKDKRQLLMKWKTDDDEKLEPLWQLLYDKTNVIVGFTEETFGGNCIRNANQGIQDSRDPRGENKFKLEIETFLSVFVQAKEQRS
jgi:hypothetical protein